MRQKMMMMAKRKIALLALLVGTSAAFTTVAPSLTSTQTFQSSSGTAREAGSNENDGCPSRRQIVHTLAGIVLLSSTTNIPKPAVASLLDDYGGSSSMKIVDVKALEQQQQARQTSTKKAESSIEPNLRSNYYYPTNKARYLPRIKKCNDAIPMAAQAIGTEDWEQASNFALKIADDTILPMKLYTSSLLGGGTNVKVAFAKDMNKASADFETAQKKLVKAIAKQDREKSSKALEDLAVALQSYREAGRLTGPDGGGDIPSVDDIRRSACRVRRNFEETVKDRDARVKQTGGVTTATNNQ